MLDKLPQAHTPFISAMDENRFNNTYTDFRHIIYEITWYLKKNSFNILHIASTACYSIEVFRNKRQWVISASTQLLPKCK